VIPTTIRPATPADLDACAETWREALNDYLPRVGQGEIPAELGPIRRLHAHLLATDPERFVVAVREAATGSGERVVGFAAAVVRGPVWFLSMLFVRPGDQGAGLGRALLERILPRPGSAADPTRTVVDRLAVCTDSAQPASNGLYARLGMLPRMPLWLAVGRPRPGWRAPALPDGVRAGEVTLGSSADVEPALQDELDAIDRSAVSFAHVADHAFIRREGRRLWLLRGSHGALVGYGYAGANGRLGPLAVLDADLVGPLVGHLLTAVEPAGASAVWLPGAADGAFAACLDAGLALEGFPVLFGWTRPFADFSRYLPLSPGLP